VSIFVDENTRIIVQGITGTEGSYWTGHMLDMGATVVAGVTPGKEGQAVRDVPVYHSVARARAAHDADAAMLFVPPRFTKDAVLEALDAGISKIVTIADGIPLHDQIEIRAAARAASAQVVGGNTSGVISPGKSMLGIFPYWITRVYKPGSIGVMTRSGSLTNEVTAMIVEKGFGVSSLIGVGGDPSREPDSPSFSPPSRPTPPPTALSSSVSSAARWKRRWPRQSPRDASPSPSWRS
jgi:succinyl-CoA synthetase alpha subunit